MYLDTQGLTGLWREGLLAQAVLAGNTSGYRSHPQLTRFKSHPDPVGAMANYLTVIVEEADTRGYRFDRSKIRAKGTNDQIHTTQGQLTYEWMHLLHKLENRSPDVHRTLIHIEYVAPNPLFTIISGDVEPWEKR